MRVWLYLGIAVCLAGIGGGGGRHPCAAALRLVRGGGPGHPRGPFGAAGAARVPGTSRDGPGAPPVTLAVAQDMFFAPGASDDVKNVVAEFRQVMSAVDGMTIDREPAPVSVGGHPGYRIDFSGVGLFRAMFAIEIRCHVVAFNLTSRDPESLASLARSLDSLDSARKEEMSDPVPECLKDYASGNIVSRVEPEGVGAKAVSIPARMIVATDGSVKHVHVIRASAAQRRNIEEAVRQWKFKPYVKQGQPVEVETGVMFNLKPTSM